MQHSMSVPTVQAKPDRQPCRSWEDKLKGKIFFITGCASAIGVENARAIAATGATLYCTARDIEKGNSALKDILDGRVELLFMDLNSLQSVRRGAEKLHSKSHGIHATSLHSGDIWMPLAKYVPDELVQVWSSTKEVTCNMKSTEQGAATSVWAAVGKEWEDKAKEDRYGKHTYDGAKEYRLWADSSKMVGLA